MKLAPELMRLLVKVKAVRTILGLIISKMDQPGRKWPLLKVFSIWFTVCHVRKTDGKINVISRCSIRRAPQLTF